MAGGVAVQLKHDSQETEWQNHGYVQVVDAEGNELARADMVQHNRNYSNRTEALKELCATVLQKLDGAAAAVA